MSADPERGEGVYAMKRPQGPGRRRARALTLRVGDREWCVWYDPWRGCSPPVLRPSVDRTWIDEWKSYDLEVDAMKKPSVLANASVGELMRIEVPKSLAKLPQVAELLIQPSWEDGEKKGQRALMMFVEGFLVKILVKVENPPLKLLVSGRSYDEAWAALEAVLRGQDVPWEFDQPREGKPGRKKK